MRAFVIVIVCGPPGAGKTTLATGLCERLAASGREFETVHSEEFSRRTYERMYERVVAVEGNGDGAEGEDEANEAESGAKGTGNWILDGTFYERQWRERFRDLETEGRDVRVVSVRASLETCLGRNRARDEPIDEQGVHVVYREFGSPEADLTIDTDDLGIEEALDRLERAVTD